MPVEFLSDDQAAAFGRFGGVPSRRELEQSAWFDDADRAVIVRHRGDGNRLGFATQLATVRLVGTFLVDPLDVPWAVVTFLAGQLGIADPSVVKTYAREKTLYEHQWEISERFGFQSWGEPAVQGELRSFLSARAWTSVEGPTRLFERATVWLRGHKVLLPNAMSSGWTFVDSASPHYVRAARCPRSMTCSTRWPSSASGAATWSVPPAVPAWRSKSR